MTDAETEHEPAAGLLGEGHRHLLHRPGVPVEDVGDPGRHDETFGLLQQQRRVRERVGGQVPVVAISAAPVEQVVRVDSEGGETRER